MTKPLEEELARLKGLVTGMGELTGVQLEKQRSGPRKGRILSSPITSSKGSRKPIA